MWWHSIGSRNGRHSDAEISRIKFSTLTQCRAFVDLLIAFIHRTIDDIWIGYWFHGIAVLMIHGRTTECGRTGHHIRRVKVRWHGSMHHLLGRRFRDNHRVWRRTGCRMNGIVILNLLLMIQWLLQGIRWESSWHLLRHLHRHWHWWLMLLMVDIVLFV